MKFEALTLQPSGAKAGSPAAAAPAHEGQAAPPGAPAAPPGGAAGILGSPIFLMLLFVPFIFMMWRRNKRETEARSKLKKGDKVIAAGIVGEIMDTDERMAKVKIAPGVTVQVLASSLAPLEEPKAPAADAKDAAKAKSKTKDEVASKSSS